VPEVLIQKNVSLKPFTTLRAGGVAERFGVARSADELAALMRESYDQGMCVTVLGSGSNVLPSDDGVRGLTVLNLARHIAVARSGEIVADSGCAFQDLFLKAAQAGLKGLEFAVGIPGTLGGALVSNAGAYRSCVSDFLTGLEVSLNGERTWVEPEFMQFSYRDSILRRPDPPHCALLKVALRLRSGDAKAIYDEAREYQRQRISKQPPSASAGSFFKNVVDAELARRLDSLPVALREAGVVPAGYLIEACGLKGYRMEGAMLGVRHANFMLNVGNASAFEIRRLAEHAKASVRERFGVDLEEEVLYLGDWSRFPS
jgi:UDP-N-acetylmuramate dehydrogenase